MPITLNGGDGTITGSTLTPTGVVLPYAGSSAPAGWLMCTGQAVSRTTYAALFAALGTTYGSGDGSTTFNLPDMRGRVPAAPDGGAGRLDWATTLGTAGGAQKHTLAESELPAHAHGITTRYNAGGFGDWEIARASGTSGGVAPTGSQNAGGGGAHNNMQPTILLNYIIKS